MEVKLVKITDKNRESLVDLALGGYIGEFCRVCGKKFLDVETIKRENMVCCGTNPLRFACKKCFDKKFPNGKLNAQEKGK